MLLHCSSLNNRSCIPFLFSIRTRRRNSNVVVVLVTRASRDTTTKPTMNVNMKPGARLCVVGRSLPTSFLWLSYFFIYKYSIAIFPLCIKYSHSFELYVGRRRHLSVTSRSTCFCRPFPFLSFWQKCRLSPPPPPPLGGDTYFRLFFIAAHDSIWNSYFVLCTQSIIINSSFSIISFHFIVQVQFSRLERNNGTQCRTNWQSVASLQFIDSF